MASPTSDITASLRALIPPESVIEIRLLNARAKRGSSYRGVVNGYFSSTRTAAKALNEWSWAEADGIYTTLNRVNPALLSRRADRLDQAGKTPSTTDSDIIHLNWLLIDFDPVRPSGVSATEEERAAAFDLAELVEAHLSSLGWPQPHQADSGNGCHRLYALDLSPEHATKDGLLHRVLKALAARFDTQKVKVDQTTYNASRITKLYGTKARKGDDTSSRPHRTSKLLTPDLRPLPVPLDLLELVAAEAPAATPKAIPTTKPNGKQAREFDLASFVRANLTITREIGPEKWEVDCPFNPDHKKNGTVGRNDHGALFFDCNHNSCKAFRWQDLTALFNPEPWKAQKDPCIGSGGVYELHESRRTTTNHDELRTNHGENRTVEVEEEDEEEEVFVDRWPTLHPAALYGLAGRFLRLIEPCSETDPVALLMTFLACVGHAATSCPHFVTEADHQTGSLYICLVGKSSRGRKGSSLGWIERLFNTMIELDPTREEILKMRDIRGLASGEGLIERMRDPEGSNERDYHRERLLVIETELAGILQRMNREGSILSPILRQGWDGKTIENPTKSNPAKVSHPHLSLIGHVTSHELSKLFGETEVFNGLGNRFLWTCVRRSKFLPIGRQPNDDDLRAIADDLGTILVDAHRKQRLHFTAQAEALWQDVYQTLETEKPSPLVDALTARSAAQVIRLGLIYALLDRSHVIDIPHLQAGLAVWDYCEQSAQALHPTAGRSDLDGKVILALERAGEEGLTRTEIHKATGSNYKADQIVSVLRRLETCRFVLAQRVERGGAVKGNLTTRYFARKVPTIRNFIDACGYTPPMEMPAFIDPLPGEYRYDRRQTKPDTIPPADPSFPTHNPPEFEEFTL